MKLLYQLVIADVRERTRRYSFLLTLGATIYLGYLVFIGSFTPRLGDYRGECNAAWVGTTMAMTCTLLLCMLGFYLVKNALARDRQTGVGEIIAAAPVSNTAYIAGKIISNFLVLTSMIAVVLVFSGIGVLVDGVEGGFNLWALVAPFVFISLPVLAFISAIAVLFETVKWLRGSFGNVVYFICIMSLLPVGMETANSLFDFAGLGMFEPSMRAAALAAYPDAGAMPFNLNPESWPNIRYFHWAGYDWTTELLLIRFLWVGIALLFSALAVICFNRFDPVGDSKKSKRRRSVVSPAEQEGSTGGESVKPVTAWTTPLVRRYSMVHMLWAELRLMVKGYHWAWYAGAAGLLIAQLFTPYEVMRGYIAPISWAWPIAIWSSMGTREARFNTGQLLFSSPAPLARQLPATWMAGMLVVVAAGGGALLRAFIAGDWPYLAALLVGTVFVPTVALTLGVVGGSKKLFEVTYMLLWYIGPMNHMPILDFMGGGGTAQAVSVWPIYLTISLALIPVLLIAGKRRLAV